MFASPRDLSADIKEMYFIDTNNKGEKKSKIPMPRHFLNGRSQPVAKSWLPVIYQLICQLSTSKICMSLKVEVFQPISLCPLSNIYHETPGRKHLKILAQKDVVTVSSAPRKT